MYRAVVLAGFLFLALSMLAAPQAHGQVLVYRMETTKAKGINYFVFESGYLVVPLLGGEGSFLMSTIEDGRAYIEAPGGGKLFTAVDGNDVKAVISATTGTGAASGAMVAMGDINQSVKINSRAYSLTAKVAKSLSGTAVTADDESDVDPEEVNQNQRSIGVAGISAIKFTLDERETDRANKDSLTVEQATEQVRLELERQGYVNLNAGDDDDDDDDEEEVEVSTLNLRGTEMSAEDLLSP